MSNVLILVIAAVVAISVLSLIIMLVKRYKRCPSDKLLVIYGKTGKDSDGKVSAARVTHGGGAFVWPIIQDYAFLDLKPISLEVNLKNALSKQNIRIDVPSTFTVAISAEDGIRENAAEKLLGLTRQDISNLTQDIVFGQMRLVIATMDIEEINADRDIFLANIQKNLNEELQKIGLKLINVNITDITDESGYIKALGQDAAAKAINEASVNVAQKQKEGAIGVADAEKDKRISVAAAKSEAEIGEADADQKRRVKVAAAISTAQIGEADAEQKRRTEISTLNAKAIEGENIAAINIAKTNSNRQIQEAEAKKNSVIAEKVKTAESLQATYDAEKIAEDKRAAKEKATQYANVIVPAEIQKERVLVEANAESEKIRTIAEGQADAKFLNMQAEAKGINEILTKQAEGFKKIVEAAGGDASKAAQLMIADKLPEIIKIQTEAIQNLKFDNITVWDNGGNGDGNSTSNFAQNMFNMVPPMSNIFKMVGLELPKFLQGASEQANAIIDASKSTDFEEVK